MENCGNPKVLRQHFLRILRERSWGPSSSADQDDRKPSNRQVPLTVQLQIWDAQDQEHPSKINVPVFTSRSHWPTRLALISISLHTVRLTGNIQAPGVER